MIHTTNVPRHEVEFKDSSQDIVVYGVSHNSSLKRELLQYHPAYGCGALSASIMKNDGCRQILAVDEIVIKYETPPAPR